LLGPATKKESEAWAALLTKPAAGSGD
jgi:hypothetical protein